MKKYLLIASLLASGTWASLYAAHVSPEAALARLNNNKSGTVKALSAKFHSTPKLESTIGNLYVFSSGQGYMILPDNDEAPALLGYSDSGKFTTEGNPALQYWLDFYNQELDYLNSNPTISNKRKKAAASRPVRAEIAPLTKTLWNQSAPYNDMCPTQDGERCVTGCVATAMAQVMKYHNYPEKGTGTHSYTATTLNQELSFDFGSTTFEWGNMTNTYDASSTDAQKEAVATLMYACGVSVDMNYTSTESGASTLLMGQSLINYFDYDKSLWMPMRDYYGLYEWEDMIYADLQQGLPVLYAGRGTAGGHQFICDGYSSDGYFHFNWGWGGLSDGYFLLTALNPPSLGIGGGAGGFNTNQQVALGVKPSTGEGEYKYIMYYATDFTPESETVAANEALYLLGSFYNYSMTEIPATGKLGVRIVSSDGSYDQYRVGSPLGEAIPVGSGFSRYGFVFPSLPDGEYTITPAFNDGTNWHDIQVPIGNIGSFIANVSDGTATLSAPTQEEASVTVSNIDAPSTIYINKNFPMSFTVTNNSEVEYIGDLYPMLIDDSGKPLALSTYSPVDVLPGESLDITGYVGRFYGVNSYTITPGTYTMVITNSNWEPLSDPVTVTFATAPSSTTISVTDFGLLSPNPVTDKSDVKFKLTVSCTEGYMDSSLVIAIFYPEGGNSVATASTGNLYLSGGESKEVTVSANLSSLDDGNYFASVFNGSTQMIGAGTPHFEIKDLTTSIDEISSGQSGEEVIYNLQGQRCERPLPAGLYIINRKKVLVK